MMFHKREMYVNNPQLIDYKNCRNFKIITRTNKLLKYTFCATHIQLFIWIYHKIPTNIIILFTLIN